VQIERRDTPGTPPQRASTNSANPASSASGPVSAITSTARASELKSNRELNYARHPAGIRISGGTKHMGIVTYWNKETQEIPACQGISLVKNISSPVNQKNNTPSPLSPFAAETNSLQFKHSTQTIHRTSPFFISHFFDSRSSASGVPEVPSVPCFLPYCRRGSGRIESNKWPISIMFQDCLRGTVGSA
jgi:hypothetical protein